MITNTGKNILAKYLIGQAPAYASYIAFGCGAPKALGPGDSFADYASYENLDFEMFRAPIVSRGYVTETVLDANDNPVEVSQIVLTAELPTEERYEITELGVFSAGSNPSAGANDSKILYTFSTSENWQYHSAVDGVSAIRLHTKPLDQLENQTQPDENSGNVIVQPEKVFAANSDNLTLDAQIRTSREERCRFLNSTIFMRGDTSAITGTGATMAVDPSDVTHIHLNGINLNLDRNSANDQLKLAFSILNKNADASQPSSAKVIVEFASADVIDGPNYEYARLKAEVAASDSDVDFASSRYFVVTKALEDLETSSGFSWNQVAIVKVYAAVSGPDSEGNPTDYSDQFYVGLDAIRLENVSTKNPLYGLTGYTVVKTDSSLPIIKEPNSANLVEFRFAMDVA